MHNRKTNKDLSLWRRILIVVARWLLALADPERMIPARPDYRQNTYSKLADGATSALADVMGKRLPVRIGEKHTRKTVTGNTGWLYAAILKRIHKKRNDTPLTLDDLVKASGLTRETVIIHTALLETLGLIAVDRREQSRTRNATNIYRLAGPWAAVSLILDGSQMIRLPQSDDLTPAYEGTDRFLQRYENNDEQTKQDVVVVGPPEEPTTEIFGEGADTRREEQDAALEADTEPSPMASIEKQAVAALETLGVQGGGDMVQRYGAARVLEVCHHYTPDKATGWIVTALQRGWHLKRKVPAEDSSPMRYITGKYADFINH